MKNIFRALMLSCSLCLFVGCSDGGGAVTDDAEQSAVEQYEANLAAGEADLDGAAPDESE
ncbi:MAG: hypothetical protein ACR2NZ_12525 [Rubripirellula sp.]